MPATVLEIIGEYELRAPGAKDSHRACFLWSLWLELVRRERDFLLNLGDHVIDRITSLAHEMPDPDLRRVFIRSTIDEQIIYLMEQTLRIQYRAALALPSIRQSGEGWVEKLVGLPSAATSFFLLRRVALQEAPIDYVKHRQVSRILFPHLRIIPDIIPGVYIDREPLGVKLTSLSNLRSEDPTAIWPEPRTFSSPVEYDVARDDDGRGDVRFRFPSLKVGGAARLSELLVEAKRMRSEAADKSFALLWPELSVDQPTFKDFLRGLQDSPAVSRAGGTRLAIPGTHSAEDASRIRAPSGCQPGTYAPNRTAVVDIETGVPVFWQDKISPVTPTIDGRRYVEAIIPAKDIRVGIADWGAFCVLICRDFVDADYTLIIDHLDVDYVFVPSMGQPNTERAWYVMCNLLIRRWGGRSALALQTEPANWAKVPSHGDKVVHTPSGDDKAVANWNWPH